MGGWFGHPPEAKVSVRAAATELVAQSARRLWYAAIVAVPVSLAHLAVFVQVEAASASLRSWRLGVMAVHGALAAWMTVVAIIGRNWHRQRTVTPSMRVAVYVTTVFVLAAGVAIAGIDQLVTVSITPYIVAAMLVAFLVRLRPGISLALFGAALGAFTITMARTQADGAVRLSNQVNGITVTAVGLGLSLLLWRSDVHRIGLREQVAVHQHQLEQTNRQLAQLAAFDTLTGLPNRRHFRELVDAEVARLDRGQEPASIAVFDLDDFKDVNDRFGHPVGDGLLRSLAQRVAARMRASDVVARWGGEEFVAMFVVADERQAATAAEALRAVVAEAPFVIDGHRIDMTVSVGVAELDERDTNPFEDAYRRADHALYAAKQGGKNRVVVDGAT